MSIVSTKCPLFKHRTGQWCKKIRSRHIYFGRDLKTALARWEREKEFLLSGRPVPAESSCPTLSYAANHWLTKLRRRVESGELAQSTWVSCRLTATRLLECLGRDLPLDCLTAQDLGRLRDHLAAGAKLTTVKLRVTLTRSFFKHCGGIPGGLVPDMSQLTRPSKAAIRRQKSREPYPALSADEVRRLLACQEPLLAAWTWLGLCGALGPADLAQLRWSHVQGSWLVMPRAKTAVDRVAWIWPEALESLQSFGGGEHVFLSGRGRPRDASGITKAYRAYLKSVGVWKPRRGHYSLRHAFCTVANRTGDVQARDVVMGHSDESMGANYVDAFPRDRVQKIGEYVRNWVLDG